MSNNAAKVAFITGAGRRVGAGIAKVLHQNNMNVVIHYNTSQEEAEALAAEMNAQRSHSAIALQGDLLDIQQFPTLVDKTIQAWGRLDVLVNNASRFYRTDIGKVTEAMWDDLLTSNLKGPFFLCQAAIPYLKQTQGCIVNIADVHAERPMLEYPVYSISKAGLVMMTKALAKELGAEVRVNAVSPGETMWPEGENMLSEEVKQKILERIPLGRKGDANQIAKAVLYFIRDADYVTGQVLAVDGGRNLHM